MRLAVVGASVRAAAQSARAAGHEVVAADLFADADLARISPATRITRWPEDFGPWLERQECDAWLYTGGLENYPDLIDEWARRRPLLGASGPGLRAVRDPERLFAVLARAGVACPPTFTTPPSQSLVGEWLVKPVRSAGGLGVRPWRQGEALSNGEVVQQRIAGSPLSAVYVSAKGRAWCWGVTRQLIAPPWTHAIGYQYAGSIGPLDLPSVTSEAIVQAGEVAAEAFELPGVWGIDFLLDSAGRPWVIELNPRYTASMEIAERSGPTAVGLHVAACLKGDLPLIVREASTEIWGKAYLFAPCDVLPGDDFTRHLHLLAERGEAADLPYPGMPIGQGQPVTTRLARGRSPEEVARLLQAGMADLTARLLATSGRGSQGPAYRET